VLIAGKGGRRFEIEQDIDWRRFGGSVQFVGALPSHRVAAFLGNADIGLHLTETHEEICSMSIIEMLAAGLPVVAEPKGCLPEMIASGSNGFLAESEREIADALTRLIQDAGLRRRLGAASRKVARRYSLDRFRSSVAGLIAEMDQRSPLGAARMSRPAGPVYTERKVEPWTPNLSILVCSTPSSGGDRLCDALWNTGVAGRPREFFDPRTVRGALPFLNGAGFAGYLGRTLEEGSTPNGVFSGSLPLSHARALQSRLARACAPRSADVRGQLRDWFPNMRLIWARRREPLEPPAPWGQIFDSWKAAPLTVWSDDLERNRERVVRMLLKELGIAAPCSLVLDALR
jgi:hypothetical protein